MRLIHSVAEMALARSEVERPLGLVPTMGALHEGHLSLVRRARSENASVVVTIFVNPTQFGPSEDLAAYPRDPDRDLALLEAEGADVVFMPPPKEVYPAGYDTWVSVERTSEPLEGASRPGHFLGVATVVCKLFNMVRPDRAYFGQKDAQQLQVIRRLNSDLNFDVKINAMPTVREPDGLAMSSRNAYLSPDQRRAAPVVYAALQAAQELYADGARQASAVREAMQRVLASEPLAQPEYVSIADPGTLAELELIDGPALASLAVRIGTTRLIDNVVLGTDERSLP
ncbi:MAG: pantoate--beta-alanine ligase [Chloroflexota bacterium]|nr:pantoate--beta-alanine ligase [Chloroflexota bacterium]MDE2941647.1 pantoate--beta-alanine ligase [Chloroflexota bacterium]MDE3267290.1 pantoate--beta-alanine ligase [Chloroflexota bacterium]